MFTICHFYNYHYYYYFLHKAICDSPRVDHQQAVRQSLYVHRHMCDWQ